MLGSLLGAGLMFFLFIAKSPMNSGMNGRSESRQILTYAEGSPDTITGKPPAPGSPSPAVYIMKDGNIFYGDIPITREKLNEMLADAKASGATVTVALDSMAGNDIQKEILGLVKQSGAPYKVADVPAPGQ